MGRPASYSMRLALATAGNMLWEVIQPLEGPSIYQDFLAAHGEGVHHVAFGCESLPYTAPSPASRTPHFLMLSTNAEPRHFSRLSHIQFNKAATPRWGKPSVLVYRRFNAEHILDRRFNAEHIRRECLPNISTAELTPFICGIRQRNENFSNLFEIGGRDMTTASYDVGGVISPRPFSLRRLGQIGGGIGVRRISGRLC